MEPIEFQLFLLFLKLDLINITENLKMAKNAR